MFGEKNPGKMYILLWYRRHFSICPEFDVIPRSCPSFSFSPNATNAFGKNYFNSNLPVSER